MNAVWAVIGTSVLWVTGCEVYIRHRLRAASIRSAMGRHPAGKDLNNGS